MEINPRPYLPFFTFTKDIPVIAVTSTYVKINKEKTPELHISRMF